MPIPQHYSIRAARDDDGPAIGRLIASVYSEYEGCPYVEDELPELAAPASHYRNLDGNLLVAEPNAETDGPISICGVLAIAKAAETGSFELFKVYVDQSARGTGLAFSLLGSALDWAHPQGLNRLFLWSDTRFLSGHRFYEKHGFERLPVKRYLNDAAKSWEFCFERYFIETRSE